MRDVKECIVRGERCRGCNYGKLSVCRYFDFGVFLWVGKVSALIMDSFGYGNGLFCAKTSVYCVLLMTQ